MVHVILFLVFLVLRLLYIYKFIKVVLKFFSFFFCYHRYSFLYRTWCEAQFHLCSKFLWLVSVGRKLACIDLLKVFLISVYATVIRDV